MEEYKDIMKEGPIPEFLTFLTLEIKVIIWGHTLKNTLVISANNKMVDI